MLADYQLHGHLHGERSVDADGDRHRFAPCRQKLDRWRGISVLADSDQWRGIDQCGFRLGVGDTGEEGRPDADSALAAGLTRAKVTVMPRSCR